MSDDTEARQRTLWQRIRAFLQGSDGQQSPEARTFAITLVMLVILAAVYAAVHAGTIMYARHLHTEGTTVDAERMALPRTTKHNTEACRS